MAKTMISARLTDQAAETLERLAAAENITVTEVIRRSISLYRVFTEEQAKGSRFIVEHSNGQREGIKFFFG